MKIEKISISLPKDAIQFVESYRKEHRLRSRSEVFAKAVKALRDINLQEQYRASYRDHAAEMKAWDGTAGDGLNDETW